MKLHSATINGVEVFLEEEVHEDSGTRTVSYKQFGTTTHISEHYSPDPHFRSVETYDPRTHKVVPKELNSMQISLDIYPVGYAIVARYGVTQSQDMYVKTLRDSGDEFDASCWKNVRNNLLYRLSELSDISPASEVGIKVVETCYTCGKQGHSKCNITVLTERQLPEWAVLMNDIKERCTCSSKGQCIECYQKQEEKEKRTAKDSPFGQGKSKRNVVKRRLRAENQSLRLEIERLQNLLVEGKTCDCVRMEFEKHKPGCNLYESPYTPTASVEIVLDPTEGKEKKINVSGDIDYFEACAQVWWEEHRGKGYLPLNNMVAQLQDYIEERDKPPIIAPTDFGHVLVAEIKQYIGSHKFVNRGGGLWAREGAYGNEPFYYFSDLINPREVQG